MAEITTVSKANSIFATVPVKQYERRNLMPGQLIWLKLKNELKYLVHPTTII
jgi:hypothetical protein